ncbi:unnamed protein product [Clavelina lepadiformis]|uniref:Conserved oligomeric Golgi complex subunit 5 n=1 Tax=Clavelina lepadiformis TaxID=159417 RepID=A0ABP0H340_CLALP
MEFNTASTEDVLQTFASDDVLADFLKEDFEVQSYTTQVIENSTISHRLAQLLEGISMLDKELQSQISSRHEDLLAQATGIESLEGVLSMMQSRINSLQSAVDRIRSKVGDPFHKIQARTTQLGRLQATCDLLRRIIRIQRLSKRLHGHLQGGLREITKAAQSLSELDFLSEGVDLSGIEILESDRTFIQRAKEEVTSQATRLLEQGIGSLNQTHTATALQVFYNLGCLQLPLNKGSDDAISNMKQSIKTALDTKSIVKNSSSSQSTKGPGKVVGLATSGNTALFRANLWQNLEVVMDQLATITNQVIHLHKVLAKKRDPVTHAQFLDELSKGGSEVQFVRRFWEALGMELRKELAACAKGCNFAKQAFEGEYPKLLRLYNDLWLKVTPYKDLLEGNLHDTKDALKKELSFIQSKQSSRVNGHEYSAEAALKNSLRDFETAYLQRSISRLFDPINLVFPSGGRNPPSNEELEAIVRTISSEISIASVDEGLAITVARNIVKTIQLFAVKSEQLVPTQGDASQVIGPPTSAQIRNVAVVNSLYSLQTNVLKLLKEQQLYPLVAVEMIRAACDELSLLMAAAVQPLVSSVADSIEAIIFTMHNEDFSQESDSRRENTFCSLYVKELRDFLSRVINDHFSRFLCQDFIMESLLPLGHRAIELFVRHASLVRPLGEGGKAKLAADFAQMESALSPLCRRVTDMGQSYRLLRAFRPLLFLADDAISESSFIGDIIPVSLILDFLFSRAPSDIRTPYETMDWSITKYSRWLDEHRSEKERLNMLRGAVENYVSSVRSRQGTKFASVYPLMVSLLQRGMEKHSLST